MSDERAPTRHFPPGMTVFTLRERQGVLIEGSYRGGIWITGDARRELVKLLETSIAADP